MAVNMDLAASQVSPEPLITFLAKGEFTVRGQRIAYVYSSLLAIWSACMKVYTSSVDESNVSTSILEPVVIDFTSENLLNSFRPPTLKSTAIQCMKNINTILQSITTDPFVGVLLGIFVYGRSKTNYSGTLIPRGDLAAKEIRTILESVNAKIK